MKKTTFVALLLLSIQCFAEELTLSAQAIESEWASIYYKTPKNKQETAYDALLIKAERLADQFPNTAEPLFWQALVIATHAELQDGFTALKAIHKSRDLLLQAIKINPQTVNGSAYVTLGTLYYMVPSWPIAFGDAEKAEKMFQAALKINPNGIDANYFYGDFLLANNKAKEAQSYFEKALSAPSRKEQSFADSKLKDEVKLALANTKNRKINGVKNTFLSLFNSASLR
ncbi:tetratricopeptide repeat protein [Methyloglobulus sp.]|uniref:tetratricopeptide repeat protein n=1 Tax=Methyloglobulus sp. TaxID=2518622 RepID=UPI0032B70CCE